jgi:hypothetical protein
MKLLGVSLMRASSAASNSGRARLSTHSVLLLLLMDVDSAWSY